jgi:hypothetical protein
MPPAEISGFAAFKARRISSATDAGVSFRFLI